MSEIIPLDEPVSSSSSEEMSTHLPSTYLVDEFKRPLTPYLRQKANGERRDSGALNLKRLSLRHLRIIEMHIAGWSGGVCGRGRSELVLDRTRPGDAGRPH